MSRIRLIFRHGRLNQKKKSGTQQLLLAKAQKRREISITVAEVTTRGSRGCQASPPHTKRSDGLNYL